MEPQVLTVEPLVVPGFLTAGECRRLTVAMDGGVAEAAEMLGETITLDESARRASLVDVDEQTLRFIEERLESARDRAARFFAVPLTGREGPSLLRYPPGGFFARHRDRGDVPAWPDAARRQVALVVFLSSSRDANGSGAFSGGVLRLLPDDGSLPPIDVIPTAGTLVAFPATTLHEVTEVRDGVRDTVVDWFY